jgi:glutathione S-transferase
VYAEKAQQESSHAALVFNCTQRAHQNTLENLPLILTTFVAPLPPRPAAHADHAWLRSALTALTMPLTAASVTGAWVVGRVLYHLGYVTGDPANVRPLALDSDPR